MCFFCLFVFILDTHTHICVGFPGGSVVKNLSANEGDKVWSLGREDSLEKEMAIHSSILSGKSHGQRSWACYCPWGHKRVGYNLLTERQQIHVCVCVCVYIYMYISSVQWLSHVWLFVIPWIAAHQASLSIANSRSLFKLMPIELVMPSSHLILCHPLLLLLPIPPSIRVFSNESTLCMR